MSELDKVKTELATTKAELERIKEGIKHANAGMIVDGGDMYDHGWVPQIERNRKIREVEQMAANAVAEMVKFHQIQLHEFEKQLEAAQNYVCTCGKKAASNFADGC